MRIHARHLSFTLLLCLLPFTAAAQEIQVSTTSSINLVDGDAASDLQLTDFNEMVVGDSRTHSFVVTNTDSANMLTFASLSNEGDFPLDLSEFNLFLAPGTSTTMKIRFEPTTSGERTGQIILNSNDPDSESEFVVNVRGTGFALPPLPAHPDLDLLLVKPPKVKLDKKTGLLDVKLKVQLNNFGTREALIPEIKVYSSVNDLLDLSTVFIFRQDLKKDIPAPVNGKIKKGVANIKLNDLPNTTATLFLTGISADGGDQDFLQNVIHTEIVPPTP